MASLAAGQPRPQQVYAGSQGVVVTVVGPCGSCQVAASRMGEAVCRCTAYPLAAC